MRERDPEIFEIVTGNSAPDYLGVDPPILMSENIADPSYFRPGDRWEACRQTMLGRNVLCTFKLSDLAAGF